jgi:NADPH-dependent curcumin reductase CurA
MKSTQIRLVARPVTEPLGSDFEVVTEALSEPGEGQVLLRTSTSRWTRTCGAG